jgi:hypothetical protein
MHHAGKNVHTSTMEWAPGGPVTLVNRARDEQASTAFHSDTAVVIMAVHIGESLSSNRFLVAA